MSFYFSCFLFTEIRNARVRQGVNGPVTGTRGTDAPEPDPRSYPSSAAGGKKDGKKNFNNT